MNVALIDGIRDVLSTGWVGNFIGIAGAILAIYFYYLSRKRSIIAFQEMHEKLLGGMLPKAITIFYDGNKIPKLSRYTAIIWNAGENTINGSDIVSSNPVRVKLKDKSLKILDSRIIETTRDFLGIKCIYPSQDDIAAELYFDYLDAKDGFTLEILHTGDPNSVELCGSIKGIPNGLTNYGLLPASAAAKKSNRMHLKSGFFISKSFSGWIVFIGGIVFFVGNLFFPLHFRSGFYFNNKPIDYLYTYLGAIYIIIGLRLILRVRRRFPNTLKFHKLEDRW